MPDPTPIDHVVWLRQPFGTAPDLPFMVWRDRQFSYGDLDARISEADRTLETTGVRPGDVVAVIGEYSPGSIALLLALIARGVIVVPLARDSADQHAAFMRLAEVDWCVELDTDDGLAVSRPGLRAGHPLLQQLRSTGQPGLVLFSSGSTGSPKAILHALPPLLEKFRTPRRRYRTINFLLFDHIGGFNTLIYTLANLGSIVVPADRSVARVCEAIARHRVELLPTSPSFLNLLLLAEAPRHYNLSSLSLITYGTEVMPERTLAMANAALPGVTFQQTYGLSELGILRSKSESNQSLFVRIGGEDYETKVEHGTLRIRAKTSMLGYLNAPSPFDEDGWFDTGDAVIEDNGFYRILGRQSDVINVGGQKVYPAEVEQVIAGMPGVIDVAVSGEPHLLLGHIVVAAIQMDAPVDATVMRRRVAEHCKGRLQPYMVPAKVRVIAESPVNYRFKKSRRPTDTP